jgi:S1-C subfamily serine protease
MKRYAPLLVIVTFIFAAVACSVVPSISLGNLFAPTETVSSNQSQVPTVVVQQPATTAPGGSGAVPSGSGNAASLDASLVDLYARVSPGVVSILVETDQGGAQGSGFVYDKQGHIVTNDHVVDGATTIEVDFADGFKVSAKVIGTDIDSDMAVLEVNAPESELVPLTLGDSDAVKVGQMVVAIGNPFGLSGTMTSGIISARGRTLDSLRTTTGGNVFSAGDVFQTDAAINPGNSGGPLLNLNGEVIGINRAIEVGNQGQTTGQATNIGIGYAIPSKIVKRVVPILISTGRYDYPYMGLTFMNDSAMTLDVINALGLSQQTGAYVVDVAAGGPGAKAGIQAGARATSIQGLSAGGDLVIGVDGIQVKAFSDLIDYVLTEKSPGDKITLTIIRDKQTKEVSLTLGKRP